MTDATRERILIRNLPLNDAQAAHLLSSATDARRVLDGLARRGVVVAVGGVWRRG